MIAAPSSHATTSAKTTSGGAACTGSSVTDDIAVYTLEAQKARLERQVKKLSEENADVKEKLAEMT